ncbi:MAG: nuclear transport factor 2 family protein [Candidatus Methanofastidiosa archaeon]|nr:nuclear transport factor 2 family protein [Candidatus Methanofastidiosa archaeon]
MNRRSFALIMVCSCILFSGCITGSEEDNAKDVVRDYYSAYNSRDATATVSLFASSVIDGAGGKDTFKENLASVFDAADQSALQLKIVRFLNVRISDDTAFVNFDVRLTDVDRDQESNVTFKLVKESGKWKILEMKET